MLTDISRERVNSPLIPRVKPALSEKILSLFLSIRCGGKFVRRNLLHPSSSRFRFPPLSALTGLYLRATVRLIQSDAPARQTGSLFFASQKRRSVFIRRFSGNRWGNGSGSIGVSALFCIQSGFDAEIFSISCVKSAAVFLSDAAVFFPPMIRRKSPDGSEGV